MRVSPGGSVVSGTMFTRHIVASTLGRLLVAQVLALAIADVTAAQSPGVRGSATRYDRLLDPVGVGVSVDFPVNPQVDVRLIYERLSGSATRPVFCSPVIPDCPPPATYRANVTANSIAVGVPFAITRRGRTQLRVVPAISLSRVSGETDVAQFGADLGVETRTRIGASRRVQLLLGADVGLRSTVGESLVADGPSRSDSGTPARVWIGMRVVLPGNGRGGALP